MLVVPALSLRTTTKIRLLTLAKPSLFATSKESFQYLIVPLKIPTKFSRLKFRLLNSRWTKPEPAISASLDISGTLYTMETGLNPKICSSSKTSIWTGKTIFYAVNQRQNCLLTKQMWEIIASRCCWRMSRQTDRHSPRRTGTPRSEICGGPHLDRPGRISGPRLSTMLGMLDKLVSISN